MALLGCLVLVLFLLLRPMELWPAVAQLHTLEVLSTITAIGIAWERTTTPRATGFSPQLGWLAGFWVWAYGVSIVRLGLDGGLKAGWAGMTLGVIFLVLVMLAVPRLERLRALMALLLGCALFVSVVAVHQGLQPRQCVELHVDISDPNEDPELRPDGRECEGARICEQDAITGSDYVCERVGKLGTYSTQGRVRWRGQLDDPNEVAVIIGALLPFIFMFARKREGEVNGAARVTKLFVLLAVLGIGLWAVVLTQSRGGQLVIGAVVVSMLVRRYGWWSIIAGVLVTLPIVLLSWREGADAEASSMERAEILSEGLLMLKAHPLIGIGVGQFASENPLNLAAHNSYLLVPTEVGIPGYLLWCGLVWMTVKIPLTVARRPPAGIDPGLVHFAEALAASTFGLHIGIFFLSFVYKHIFFVWLALAGALHGAVKTAHPDFEVRVTRKDVAGIFAFAVLALVAVRLASMTAR